MERVQIDTSICTVCGAALHGRQRRYCSRRCKNRDTNNHHQSYLRQHERAISNKVALVKLHGGRCTLCGYSRNLAAREFHHRKPAEKQFALDARTLANRSLAEIRAEALKCDLLCSNCHAEVHHPWASEFQTEVGTESEIDSR